jgi:hypothetical protein
MKLSNRALQTLAKMVCGDHKDFPYRSSSYITSFFERCSLPFVHKGETRAWWTEERLKELNLNVASSPDLPSDDLIRVISELFDHEDFEKANLTFQPAIFSLNRVLEKEGLICAVDHIGKCTIQNTGTGANSANTPQRTRPLSATEIEQRNKLAVFLDSASEDDFTEKVLVPLFQRLGFHRVSAAGHKEKTLEFGKDLWMKFQLPTGHWIYFCAQIKKEKIDSSGTGGNNNVANVLTQAKMAIDHPIFDPDANRKVLLDHVFLISAGEITRAARTWLVEQLDKEMRRHIIFMDRDEFLDHAARILLDLKIEEAVWTITDDDIPF